MTMEERKASWRNRVYAITPFLTPPQLRLISAVCQDAFNQGWQAGYQHGEAQGKKEDEDVFTR